MLDIETENQAVLVVLNQADEFYREQQKLAKALRKGFLDLAKARSAVGPSGRISALDCREELQAQYAVDGDEIDGVEVKSLEASQPWRAHTDAAFGGARAGVGGTNLRRRGGDDDDNGADLVQDGDAQQDKSDTVLLFAGLAPPALRKAKKEFVLALNHVLKIANASQRIQVAQAKLKPSLQQERFST
mmetsp:Transcript_3404/g.11170  ORF Transcript_3404/g.11170 Transcript_3404/m.11170 type:complete len:188 (-) Transcript_3404:791-1354(-)|eukprot:CAMPEP_0118915244 /NCGR_PEP_ID=MMETSP1166-20130328/15443_1 /TAXON_ID=1104430 /ORGANISM="Chrysoreinhardia sp, Strain CCMP3193" /LENGTH=187 /DNA_ID=CAMNT_0006854907 /DNA_START=45 /DNA_END=608 /DNA_ORIENTATION=+